MSIYFRKIYKRVYTLNHMKVHKWLTINSRRSARLTQSKPNLTSDEIAIKLDINVPDELFRKPRLEAKIDIPKEAAGPDKITSEVVENVKEAIESATGLTFSINVIKEEVPESEH